MAQAVYESQPESQWQQAAAPARRRHRMLATATVLGCNATLFAAAQVWSLTRGVGDPGWEGLALLVFTLVNAVAVAGSTTVGLVAMWLLTPRPTRWRHSPRPGSGQAILAGTLAAAAGIVPLTIAVALIGG